MDPAAAPFPPAPIRGVRALYVRQAGCPSDFAEVTVDFEPWEEGVAFEVADGAVVDGCSPDEAGEFRAGLLEGVRDELACLDEEITVAVAVVLRSLRAHEVDSHPRAFRAAGRLAVRNALTRLYGPPPRPKRRRR
ncbi:hypothetical protein [Streptomyces sp. ISL-11]|uniref:hypothetical protein n=1 Tax=Streptomyces sp. ISL-11 TaxID=2819174 RepID=UPI001BEB7ABB|nr:hypothetical protein [Streptomyces sp. ISL-11]MBT2382407.1 hypothetical protein [Streptomyces sp. ISL-11]